jgi:hypothetical protein
MLNHAARGTSLVQACVGLEKISSRFKFGINHTGPYDFLVDRSRPLTVPLPQVFI